MRPGGGSFSSPADHPKMMTPLIPTLVEQLKKHPEQALIVEILRRAGPQVAPDMAKLIEPPFTQPVAASAASVLYCMPKQAKTYVPLLLRAADAGNNWALAAAFAADLDGTLRSVTEQLQAKDAQVRRRAAESLFLMGPLNPGQVKNSRVMVQAIDGLIERIDSGDGETLRACVRALPWFCDEVAIACLERLAARNPKEISAEEIKDCINRIHVNAEKK